MTAKVKRKRNPNLNVCRTGRVGAAIPGAGREMFYCRIENEECKYVRPFGFDFICNHPNAELILAEASDGDPRPEAG